MTKAELIEALKDMPDDAQIVLPSCRDCTYNRISLRNGKEIYKKEVKYKKYNDRIYLYVNSDN